MRRHAGALAAVPFIALLAVAACQQNPTGTTGESIVAARVTPRQSCWGQASAVFAQLGEMGEHASEQPTPRLGLRNLARALADDGVIADDSMEALGEFVAAELGLSIDACMS